MQSAAVTPWEYLDVFLEVLKNTMNKNDNPRNVPLSMFYAVKLQFLFPDYFLLQH